LKRWPSRERARADVAMLSFIHRDRRPLPSAWMLIGDLRSSDWFIFGEQARVHSIFEHLRAEQHQVGIRVAIRAAPGENITLPLNIT